MHEAREEGSPDGQWRHVRDVLLLSVSIGRLATTLCARRCAHARRSGRVSTRTVLQSQEPRASSALPTDGREPSADSARRPDPAGSPLLLFIGRRACAADPVHREAHEEEAS